MRWLLASEEMEEMRWCVYRESATSNLMAAGLTNSLFALLISNKKKKIDGKKTTHLSLIDATYYEEYLVWQFT